MFFNGIVARIIIFISIIFFAFISCTSFDKTIEKQIGIDVSKCTISEEKDTHGGFLGDGDYYAIFDCSKNKNYILEHLNTWNKLPLSKNIEFAVSKYTDIDISKINNGYYYFIDRYAVEYKDIKDIHSDEKLLDRYAFNFTIAIYDSDTNMLHYYELDT